jgi:hypothetical protein
MGSDPECASMQSRSIIAVLARMGGVSRTCGAFLGTLVAAWALCPPAGAALVTDAPVSGVFADGPVYALLRVADGSVYIGGDFTEICPTSTTCAIRSRIAHIAPDGTLLPALGSAAATATNRAVRALAIGGDGALYAGGDFSAIGGVGIGNAIARWDGRNWNALRTGLEGPVYAITVSGSDVIAGGDFDGAAGTQLGNIARWDGSDWHAMGLGASGTVLALVTAGANVYAGGSFATMVGAADQTARIARWDGSAWQPLGDGINGTYDEVRAITVSGADVYAGGAFSAFGPDRAEAKNVARFDGSVWHALGTGADGPVNALVMAGGELYAGGDFLSLGSVLTNRLAAWNGTAWSKVGTGTDAAVRALVAPPDGSRLFAGGVFTKIGGVGHPYLAVFTPPAAADRVAPRLTASIPAQRLGAVLSKGIKVKVTCDEATKVAVRITVRGRRMGELTQAVKAKTATTVTVKLTPSSVRRLRAARRAPFNVTASAVDGAGNHGSTSATRQLKR